MGFLKELILPALIFGIFVCCVASQESRPDTDENQNAPSNSRSSGYGKRPSGHSFVRFGKRADNRGHSYMYFGKRATTEDSNIADFLQYLQRSQEPSWKRGHSIMRFGKRMDKHNFIRFGKRDASDNILENEDGIEDDKRGGHSMMYFGKRGGHSMLYFGKRIPYIEDNYDKRGGHSMLYFGKRSPYTDNDFQKKGGHSMMYFGKRSPNTEDENYEKRREHSMMYFGKRSPYVDGDDYEKRGGHSMLYFGKRMAFSNEGFGNGEHDMIDFEKIEPYISDNPIGYDEDESIDAEMGKRGPHSMIHFGKRYDDEETENGEVSSGKRAHSMIHFGKRSDDPEDSLSNFTNEDEKRAGHGMIHFGKRQNMYDVGNDAWAHSQSPFDSKNDDYSGLLKPDEDMTLQKKDNKKSHMMIHFGKRSVDSTKMSNNDQLLNRKGEENKQKGPNKKLENEKKSRTKRDVEPSNVPLLPFSDFISRYEETYTPEEGYSDYGFEHPLAPNSLVPIRNTRSNGSSGKSKNVFLRFGKR